MDDQTLLLPHCRSCGRWLFMTRRRCSCGSEEEPQSGPHPGTGHVFSHTITHVAFHPDTKDHLPYATLLVELDKGPRVLALLPDWSADAPPIGTAVRVTVEEGGRRVARPIAPGSDSEAATKA